MIRPGTFALLLLTSVALPAQLTRQAAAHPDSASVTIIQRPPVIYSRQAEEKKLQGTVALIALFDESGAGESVEMQSGDPILAECAKASIKDWRIEPFWKDGAVVKVSVPLTFQFVYDRPVVNFITGEKAGPGGANVERVTLSRPLAHTLEEMVVAPVYPAEPGVRVQGTVSLITSVARDGHVTELKVIEGHPLLIPAAMEAVRQWRYKPFEYRGKPAAFDTRVDVTFYPPAK